MKTQIESIIHNLTESFDGKPWYGVPVMEKLNQISWEIVNDKTYNSKSIAILVQHIFNWRLFVIKKLAGDLSFNIVMDGENDWDAVHIKNEEEWNLLKRKLQNSQDTLIQKLSEQTDELLLRKVPGKEYTFGPVLTSVAQHDIYHLGQIAMLNAIQQR